ncbi:BamA/TamA family outer membrane protein [Microcoleus sp. FACHB-831]|nr:BamA/TamA family outer membrane protein [Microcoleus sp. FACHB-831]
MPGFFALNNVAAKAQSNQNADIAQETEAKSSSATLPAQPSRDGTTGSWVKYSEFSAVQPQPTSADELSPQSNESDRANSPSPGANPLVDKNSSQAFVLTPKIAAPESSANLEFAVPKPADKATELQVKTQSDAAQIDETRVAIGQPEIKKSELEIKTQPLEVSGQSITNNGQPTERSPLSARDLQLTDKTDIKPRRERVAAIPPWSPQSQHKQEAFNQNKGQIAQTQPTQTQENPSRPSRTQEGSPQSEPTQTPEPQLQPAPTQTPELQLQPAPTQTPEPQLQPAPTQTPDTPSRPSQTQEAPAQPEPTQTPEPQLQPAPTQTPDTPSRPRQTQEAPAQSEPTQTPEPQLQPAPAQETPSEATQEPEPRVLVAEVLVTGVEGELQNLIYQTIRTQPGRTATRSQLQEDVNAIYATGYFAQVNVEPADTALGVRVSFVVQPNPVLRQVSVSPVPEGAAKQALPQQVIDEAFKAQYGQVLNLRNLQEGIKRINQWYKDNGYDLAQVIETPQINADGNVTLLVAEGVVEDVEVRFLSKEREATDSQGRPIRGRTRNFIITRELELKRGDVFNRNTAQRDLRRVYGLGIFEDVQLSFSPGKDPRQVVVVVNAIEKNTGSIAAGAGISSASGLFGTLSYQQQNLGGNNQKLGGELQVGQRELLFDVNFTDPWIAGDPYRTSYTVNAFRRRTISLIFDGGEREVDLPGGDRPRVLRLGGGVNFTRPLSRNPLATSEWVASLGLQYQRVSIRDRNGDISPKDELGNRLSFSESGKDDLTTVQFGVSRDRRNNPLQTTSGSLLRLGVEQSIPIGSGNIFLSRLRGSYSHYIPVNFTRFNKGPQALAFNIQGGTALGDLPPYEAFSLGGSNSVRGYQEGDVGAGRSFIQATAEYRFPIFSIVGGALFVDIGTDLGTGRNVPGDPAGVRGKPGSGLGFGLGVRVQSPLGPIRVDYGFNEQGEGRLHFGIGERF